MKILVTGAAGFIGSSTVRELALRGDHIVGIDNLNPYPDVQLKEGRLNSLKSIKNFRFEKIDIADKVALDDLFEKEKFDQVVHLAAQPGVRYSIENPNAYLDSNLTGFLNILEACRHNAIRHLVFASSSSVYGANSLMPYSTHRGADHPLSLYAATKKANEVMAHSYAHLYKVPMTGLRFFTVYGPWGRPDMAVFMFTKKILNREAIEVFNQGHHRRDFTYIDDIVGGVVRVLDEPAIPNSNWNSKEPDPSSSQAPYRIYNIGNSQPVLLSDFISTLEDILGIEAKKIFKEAQPGDVPDTYADITDLEEIFGFRPQTTLRDGLKKFVHWYKDYYKISL